MQHRNKSFLLLCLLGLFPFMVLAHQEVGIASGFVSSFPLPHLLIGI